MKRDVHCLFYSLCLSFVFGIQYIEKGQVGFRVEILSDQGGMDGWMDDGHAHLPVHLPI